ncbi:MAG: rRNA maturation RNase YbeY [Butyrivibrio sp.]|nr:rRNA maturation RNase YbeY [Acetatifactor muris]MCM1560520.1 rRNA maturation RNase YbeY [Butyrivibrio sp.]
MTFYVENETEEIFPFDVRETAEAVCRAVLEEERCPYEARVELVITDNEGIREMNRESRGIDRETDVLSFPNVDFEREGCFKIEKDREADYFDPDTGELILGDIMISADKVRQQALEYGHSLRREFAFLVAHSMFHLCGYDHMEEQAAEVMERKQEEVLERLGIRREV